MRIYYFSFRNRSFSEFISSSFDTIRLVVSTILELGSVLCEVIPTNPSILGIYISSWISSSSILFEIRYSLSAYGLYVSNVKYALVG